MNIQNILQQFQSRVAKGFLLSIALILIWLGASWLNGWFPFAVPAPAPVQTLRDYINDATATGPSTLSAKEAAAAENETTAKKGVAVLSASTTAAFIEAATAK